MATLVSHGCAVHAPPWSSNTSGKTSLRKELLITQMEGRAFFEGEFLTFNQLVKESGSSTWTDDLMSSNNACCSAWSPGDPCNHDWNSVVKIVLLAIKKSFLLPVEHHGGWSTSWSCSWSTPVCFGYWPQDGSIITQDSKEWRNKLLFLFFLPSKCRSKTFSLISPLAFTQYKWILCSSINWAREKWKDWAHADVFEE